VRAPIQLTPPTVLTYPITITLAISSHPTLNSFRSATTPVLGVSTVCALTISHYFSSSLITSFSLCCFVVWGPGLHSREQRAISSFPYVILWQICNICVVGPALRDRASIFPTLYSPSSLLLRIPLKYIINSSLQGPLHSQGARLSCIKVYNSFSLQVPFTSQLSLILLASTSCTKRNLQLSDQGLTLRSPTYHPFTLFQCVRDLGLCLLTSTDPEESLRGSLDAVWRCRGHV